MAKQTAEFYHEQQRKKTIWVESPSKFMKPPTEPAALSRYAPVFIAGSTVDGVFKDDPHTAWESY